MVKRYGDDAVTLLQTDKSVHRRSREDKLALGEASRMSKEKLAFEEAAKMLEEDTNTLHKLMKNDGSKDGGLLLDRALLEKKREIEALHHDLQEAERQRAEAVNQAKHTDEMLRIAEGGQLAKHTAELLSSAERMLHRASLQPDALELTMPATTGIMLVTKGQELQGYDIWRPECPPNVITFHCTVSIFVGFVIWVLLFISVLSCLCCIGFRVLSWAERPSDDTTIEDIHFPRPSHKHTTLLQKPKQSEAENFAQKQSEAENPSPAVPSSAIQRYSSGL